MKLSRKAAIHVCSALNFIFLSLSLFLEYTITTSWLFYPFMVIFIANGLILAVLAFKEDAK